MNQFRTLYFIGIKGIGMSALAILAKGLGYDVSGSDAADTYGPTGALLAKSGIHAWDNFAAEHITPEIDLVVVGAAFGDDNPEVTAAKEQDIELWSYSQLQGYIARDKKTLAVAGTHGKTTTTSLLTYLFYKDNKAPSWIIGTGEVSGLPSHGGAGTGDYFITEADDYKSASNDPTPKFLDLSPFGAIITSIEHDHPDLYPTLEDCIHAFRQFLQRVDPQGIVVANYDDKNVRHLLTEFPELPVVTYGEEEGATYRIQINNTAAGSASSFSLVTDRGVYGPFELQLVGLHNIYNAAAAVIIALHCSVSEAAIQTILPTFRTVERRFQLLGQRGEQIIIDDYAHHPTAVQLTLEAAKKHYPDRPLWVVFQSHTYSRTKALLAEFGQAFGAADSVIITDIFASAREKEVTVTAEELTREIATHNSNVHYVAKDGLLDYLRHNLPTNAVLITMGAGDIYKIGKQFLDN